MEKTARDTTVFVGIPCYNRLQGLARQVRRCRSVEKHASRLSQSLRIV